MTGKGDVTSACVEEKERENSHKMFLAWGTSLDLFAVRAGYVRKVTVYVVKEDGGRLSHSP